jgi:hypothetical protein
MTPKRTANSARQFVASEGLLAVVGLTLSHALVGRVALQRRVTQSLARLATLLLTDFAWQSNPDRLA